MSSSRMALSASWNCALISLLFHRIHPMRRNELNMCPLVGAKLSPLFHATYLDIASLLPDLCHPFPSATSLPIIYIISFIFYFLFGRFSPNEGETLMAIFLFHHQLNAVWLHLQI